MLIYILIITWSWCFDSLMFSYIWRGHSGHDHMVAIYILYMNYDLNGMWYGIPYLFYDVTGRINPRMDYAFCLLHIEEFWKMAIPIIWCYRQLQPPNSTLRCTIFSISLAQMSFIYCHLNFHPNLVRPWLFPLTLDTFGLFHF